MGKKVLIADDSTSMRQMIEFTLSDAGYTVVQSVDGEDAVSKFAADVNLVITDLNMPKMNGIDLIKRIRGGAVNKFLPIIMLTTESEQAKKDEGKTAGATAWIVKPFTPDNLLDTIKKVIG
ncbi:MAG TPA: response regulator [Chitinispirillaceae bacterium]|nr:response regulator [Chitinispirillaceae bacterium]